jgi:hypothetical protein
MAAYLMIRPKVGEEDFRFPHGVLSKFLASARTWSTLLGYNLFIIWSKQLAGGASSGCHCATQPEELILKPRVRLSAPTGNRSWKQNNQEVGDE